MDASRSSQEEALAAQDVGQRNKQDYELLITLPDLPKKGDKTIWRRVRVSGATRIGSFFDKILAPAMGWCVFCLPFKHQSPLSNCCSGVGTITWHSLPTEETALNSAPKTADTSTSCICARTATTTSTT